MEVCSYVFFFPAEDGIRGFHVTGVQTCALPISLDRPFDPVLDMGLLGDAVEVVKRSIGTAGAVGGVVVAVLLMIGVLTLMALSALRLTRIVASHRRPAIGTAAVL